MGYITVSVSEDIDVDVDEIIDEISTQELIDELKKRASLPLDISSDENVSIDYQMKAEVIQANIHKFSYLEICEIFENKKF